MQKNRKEVNVNAIMKRKEYSLLRMKDSGNRRIQNMKKIDKQIDRQIVREKWRRGGERGRQKFGQNTRNVPLKAQLFLSSFSFGKRNSFRGTVSFSRMDKTPLVLVFFECSKRKKQKQEACPRGTL